MSDTLCKEDGRRDAVRRMEGRNGLDYVEVEGGGTTLQAFFLGRLPEELRELQTEASPYLELTGGTRRQPRIVGTRGFPSEDPERDDVLEVYLDGTGDASLYTLRLVGVAGVDPRYDRASFRFGLDCPSELDCRPACPDPAPEGPGPDISYLAKDYASFRRLMLDRMAVTVPEWRERHAADLGVALVEVMAYVGDYLSYYQDAVATEAYLETARKRISVRRHVRLVDYRLSEGCNARTWVCIESDSDFELPAHRTAFATGRGGDRPTVLGWEALQGASYETFEPVGIEDDIVVRAAHSRIGLYTWGGRKCALEKGATRATLRDAWASEEGEGRSLHLKPGDVLILEEIVGPRTGLEADADPARRHPVRLTRVERTEDPVYAEDGRSTPLVEVEWAAADRLPFALCLSTLGPAPECAALTDVSVARGNAILVDHGRTQPVEDLGAVPTVLTDAACDCEGQPGEVERRAGPFAPVLRGTPLTFREPLPRRMPPAAKTLLQDPERAEPQVRLASVPARGWGSRYDLIASRREDGDYVVEIDDEGLAHLRFGDGELGASPKPGMAFAAAYRLGNGKAGNVGADTITHLVLTDETLDGPTLRVRNPLPAVGGTEPETVEEAKRFAPGRFRSRIERAVVAEDYQSIAERDPRLQRGAARLVWTGSWYEADVAVDPLGTEEAGEDLIRDVRRSLERYRRMGHDLHVVQARYVPLEVGLEVCVDPDYPRGGVRAALRKALGAQGLFHPDRLTFGGGVYLSPIVAAAQGVDGVRAVGAVRFGRLGDPPNGELESGVVPLAHDEIGQLDDDPVRPERGRLDLKLMGGR